MHRSGVQGEAIRAHVRRTLTPKGELVPVAFVRCPREARMVEMTRCATCGHCAELFVEEATQTPVLSCQLSPAARPRSRAGSSPRPGARSVGEALERETICLEPDVDLKTCAAIFRRFRLGRAPVLDADGGLLGTLSRGRLAAELRRARASCHPGSGGDRRARVAERLSARRVGDVLEPAGATVSDAAPLARAAALLLEAHQDELIVLDERGQVVGAISAREMHRSTRLTFALV